MLNLNLLNLFSRYKILLSCFTISCPALSCFADWSVISCPPFSAPRDAASGQNPIRTHASLHPSIQRSSSLSGASINDHSVRRENEFAGKPGMLAGLFNKQVRPSACPMTTIQHVFVEGC